MWTYILAATRGERRAPPSNTRCNAGATIERAVFTISSPRSPTVTISNCDKDQNVPGPSWMSSPPDDTCADDGTVTIESFTTDDKSEEKQEDRPAPNGPYEWVRRHLARFGRAFRNRFRREKHAVPPDWFLDKFATKEFQDPEAPTEEPKGSKFCCGVRFAFDPTLRGHYRWLAVVSLSIVYNVVFIIARAVFWELNNTSPIAWFTIDYICDAVYIIDTIIHMHEGYLEQGLMVKEPKLLRLHYIKSSVWKYDFMSSLPTDIIYYWWGPTECSAVHLPCPVIMRMNRLCRIPRMWEFFDRTETATSYPNVFRICKVVLGILILIHWNACIYFAISFAIGFGTDNWVYNLNGTRNESLGHQYIYSFYWSTLTLTTIGETPQPEQDGEFIFVVSDFLAGVLIFATIVGNIGSMISNMNVSRVEFQNRMDGVKQYMAFRKVGRELEARVIRWFAYTWAQSGALDEENVLACLPDKLKAEIAIRVHLDTLRQVRIFQDCEPGLLEALVLKLRLQVFSPGDYICRKGDVGKEMYIVKRGRLQVVGDDGKSILAVLSAGSVFGEVSVLEIAGNRTGNRRTANVRALGYSDLFCLAKRDLWEALGDYPEARATLTERGCQLLRKDGLLDEAVYQNAQLTQESLEEKVKTLENVVAFLKESLKHLVTNVEEEQARLKQRMCKLEERKSESDDDTDIDGYTYTEEVETKADVEPWTENTRQHNALTRKLLSVEAGTSTGPSRPRGNSLTAEGTPNLTDVMQRRTKSLKLKKTFEV